MISLIKWKYLILTYVVTVISNFIPHTPAFRTVLREIYGHILTSSVRQLTSNYWSAVWKTGNMLNKKQGTQWADISFPLFWKTAYSLRQNMSCFQFQHRSALVRTGGHPSVTSPVSSSPSVSSSQKDPSQVGKLGTKLDTHEDTRH